MTHLTLYVMKWKKRQNIEAHYHSFIDQNCLSTETEVKDTGVGHLLKKTASVTFVHPSRHALIWAFGAQMHIFQRTVWLTVATNQ